MYDWKEMCLYRQLDLAVNPRGEGRIGRGYWEVPCRVTMGCAGASRLGRTLFAFQAQKIHTHQPHPTINSLSDAINY